MIFRAIGAAMLLCLLSLTLAPGSAQAASTCDNRITVSSWVFNRDWYNADISTLANITDTANADTATQALSLITPGAVIAFDMKWGEGNGSSAAGNAATVTIAYGGVTYATIVTTARNISGNATGTASNGATLNATSYPLSPTVTHVVLTLPATIPASGNLVITDTVNTAQGGSAGDDIYLVNVAVSPTGCAVLYVAKSDGVASVTGNTNTTYTVTITNQGGGTATAAVLSDPAATGLNVTAVACGATPGKCVTPPTVAQLQSGTFALPTMAMSDTYQLSVTARVTVNSGSVTNTARVTVPGTTDVSGTDTDTVTAAPTTDLGITKNDGLVVVKQNDVVTYAVVVTNTGTSVTGAILSDPVVAGLNVTAVVCGAPAGVCTAGTTPTPAALQSGTYALPVMASGATYKLNVTGTITASSGSVTNVATIAAPTGTFDSASGNNTASDVDALLKPMTISKISAAYSDPVNGTTLPKYIPGAFVDYTILVSNPNAIAIDASSVVVIDTAPTTMAFSPLDINGVGSGPAQFIDGSPTSALTYTFTSLASTTDSIAFSADNGATWTRTPVADANGVDNLVTSWRVTPAGSMAANSSFSIKVRYKIK